MFGKLNSEDIEDLLKHQVVGRIGCHADGITYVVPISYAYDGDYIYAHTFEGMKLNVMRKNAKICFQVDVMQNMANWQSVIAWGEFEELKEHDQRSNALQKLIDRELPLISSDTTHLTPHWPFPAEDIDSIKGIIFRIKLTSKTGRFEKSVSNVIYRG